MNAFPYFTRPRAYISVYTVYLVLSGECVPTRPSHKTLRCSLITRAAPKASRTKEALTQQDKQHLEESNLILQAENPILRTGVWQFESCNFFQSFEGIVPGDGDYIDPSLWNNRITIKSEIFIRQRVLVHIGLLLLLTLALYLNSAKSLVMKDQCILVFPLQLIDIFIIASHRILIQRFK